MVQETHKGVDSQREQGQGRSAGSRSEAFALELLCERQQGVDVQCRAQGRRCGTLGAKWRKPSASFCSVAGEAMRPHWTPVVDS